MDANASRPQVTSTIERQLELPLRDWQRMFSAPTDCTWIEIECSDGAIVRAHFAQDLSGEEQPSYSGWFVAVNDAHGKTMYFAGVFPKPKRWRPLA